MAIRIPIFAHVDTCDEIAATTARPHGDEIRISLSDPERIVAESTRASSHEECIRLKTIT